MTIFDIIKANGNIDGSITDQLIQVANISVYLAKTNIKNLKGELESLEDIESTETLLSEIIEDSEYIINKIQKHQEKGGK